MSKAFRDFTPQDAYELHNEWVVGLVEWLVVTDTKSIKGIEPQHKFISYKLT
jgi:hypothetical protein